MQLLLRVLFAQTIRVFGRVRGYQDLYDQLIDYFGIRHLSGRGELLYTYIYKHKEFKKNSRLSTFDIPTTLINDFRADVGNTIAFDLDVKRLAKTAFCQS